MERDDAGCVDHQKTGRSDSSQRKTYFDDNRGVEIHRRNSALHHLNAYGRKCLLQYGERVDCIRPMGEVTLRIQEEVELVETQLDSTIV